MNQKKWFVLWGILFAVCAALGFFPEPAGIRRWLQTGLSVLFFLPPGVLLYRSREKRVLQLIRNLSALSLGLTLVTLVGNFVFALRSEALGTVLHYILVVVSSPMICSGYWVLSLFLWACLLMTAMKKLKQ